MVTEVYFFAGRQSNPVGEHTHMERGKIQKAIEFYQIIECDACLGSNPMFFIREINLSHQFCPFTIT